MQKVLAISVCFCVWAFESVLSNEYCKIDKECKCVNDDSGMGLDFKLLEKGSPFSTTHSNNTYFLSLCEDSKILPEPYNTPINNCTSNGYSVYSYYLYVIHTFN